MKHLILDTPKLPAPRWIRVHGDCTCEPPCMPGEWGSCYCGLSLFEPVQFVVPDDELLQQLRRTYPDRHDLVSPDETD